MLCAVETWTSYTLSLASVVTLWIAALAHCAFAHARTRRVGVEHEARLNALHYAFMLTATGLTLGSWDMRAVLGGQMFCAYGGA